jgi:CHAT domain-containing protein
MRKALPEGAALLEYAFMDDGLHVFLVNRRGVTSQVLLPAPAPANPADDFLDPRLEARAAECSRLVGVDRLVSQILQGDPPAAGEEARRLWDLLVAPLEPGLQGVESLLVVPDRDLHFLPFEALLDPQGRRLLERFSVTYMNTARELFAPPASGRRGALVLGGPAYSLPGRPAEAGVELRRLGGPWSELVGARQEAEEVAGLEGVPAHLGPAATETCFKGLAPAASALHLATHGFVGAPALPPGVSRVVARRPQDVLGDCGLVLAGANTGGDGQEDGILTAYEVLGMDLGDVDLVVLSACDTGRGEVNAYEGVFGLKRSFLAAGARQVVYTMWPVSDQGTRALMARFYHHLGQGLPTSQALRAARLELLRGDPVLLEEGLAEEPEQFQDPFFWAPFALVGRPDR